MPYTCFVPGCKGNYSSAFKVCLCSFPRDEFLRKKWVEVIHRKESSITKHSRVCEVHFKETDFETEASAYDPKTGVTITCPLLRKRLKKGIVPSLLLPSSDSVSSNGKSSSQQKKQLKSELSTKEQNKLKWLPAKSGQLKENSKAASPTASILGNKKDEKSKEMVKRKRKPAASETSNKKTDSTSKLNETPHTSNGVQASGKSTVANSKLSDKPVCTNPEAFAFLNVQVKREPLSDEEKHNGPSRKNSEENISEYMQITNVRSLSSERSNAGSPIAEVNSAKKPDENLDGNFYSKPLDMDQRDKAFGSFVACELSDLRVNPALYMKTKQTILKLLTEAHFEQMSSGFDLHPHTENFHQSMNPALTPHIQSTEESGKHKNKATDIKVEASVLTTDFTDCQNLLIPVVSNSATFSGGAASKLLLPFTSHNQEKRNDGNKKLWPCTPCNVPVKTEFKLNVDFSAHILTEKTVPCNICDELFSTNEHVQTHIHSVHNEKSCSSDVYSSDFSCHSKLLDHTQSNAGNRPFHCEICGQNFSHKSHFTRHSKIHTGEKPYSCDFCGHRFYRKDKLNRHRRIHTGEKPYACVTCGETFNRKDKLTTHTKKHNGKKALACVTCGETFDRKDKLTTHTKKHNGFDCVTCGETFNRKAKLTTHTKKHNGKKALAWVTCGETFNRKDKLTTHIKKHNGKKALAWVTCGETFNWKDKLTTHIKKHNGKKALACTVCGKSFVEDRKLKRHKCSLRNRQNKNAAKK